MKIKEPKAKKRRLVHSNAAACAGVGAPFLPRKGPLPGALLGWEMEGTMASSAAGTAVGGGGRQVGPILKIVRTAHSAEQQLSTVRQAKNFLVGNEQAKLAALGLSVVEDIITFLDAAGAAAVSSNSNCHNYKSSLLHGIGLLGILNSPPLPRGLAEKHLAPSGSRVLEHIVRALEMASSSTTVANSINGSSSNINSGERLTATALRAISSLCTCFVPLRTTGAITCFVDAAAEAACTATPTATAAAAVAKEEEEKSLAVLRKTSVLILNEIVATTSTAKIARGQGRSSQSSRCWSASLATLGLQALAAMTRVDNMARSLVQQVVSTEAVLLAPIW